MDHIFTKLIFHRELAGKSVGCLGRQHHDADDQHGDRAADRGHRRGEHEVRGPAQREYIPIGWDRMLMFSNNR